MRERKEIEISIIMGVYNPKNSVVLQQAVRSMIQQTFRNWEMLMYDDGSDSEYIPVIEAAAKLDSRILLIRGEENRGLAYALNQCIRQAKGKYIARMDDDDISMPDRLEKLYEFLEHHKEYQWAGSNSELIDDEGVWGIEKMREIPCKTDFLSYSPYIHPSVVFRKDILKRLNGYKVAAETMRCEDYELFMRLHQQGYKGYNLQENLLKYREDHEGFKKRKYCYRVKEAKVRYEGFKKLGILKLHTMPYVVKPLVAGLVSPDVVKYMKRSVRRVTYAKGHRTGEAG